MNHRLIIPVVLLLAGLSGCAKTHSTASLNHADAVSSDDQVKNVPFSASTHYAAGQLAESRGDFANAISHYKYALAVDNTFTLAMYRLGCVYAETQRYTESVQMWHKYLAATKDAASGYSNLAYTEELAGNPSGAEADYKTGIAKDPTNEPCRVNYGLMLARHGRIGEAVIQLQAVLPPEQVHYNLATVYELEHRSEQAKLEYQEALALDPNFTDAREKLATLGDYSQED